VRRRSFRSTVDLWAQINSFIYILRLEWELYFRSPKAYLLEAGATHGLWARIERLMPSANWGNRPWTITFCAKKQPLPPAADFVLVGGGFTGLAAAASLKRQAPQSTVVLLEARYFGHGASGNTGGMALAESAAGDLPGLDDVLAGYTKILRELEVDGDVHLPGVYEVARNKPMPDSPMRWNDSGQLAAVKQVPGGSVNPGKVVSGLASAADGLGVLLFECATLLRCEFGNPLQLHTSVGLVAAKKVLFATNAFSLELTGWSHRAEACFTAAVATQDLSDAALEQIGLAHGKPFYTVDLPYLWGRLLGKQIVFGAGLVHFRDWRDMEALDITKGEAAETFAKLEKRVHNLHPKLREVRFTHRWGGPICITEDWRPIFEAHSQNPNAIVLGGFSGHGVAQSVYLGAWAAEALLGKRALPDW
jgi:glycine/D-amino acid oxidase-like deaminating enzyme